MRRNEQGYDKAPLPEALQFTARQPDGREVIIDMSAPGGFSDFAFDVSDSGEVARFVAYWTEECAIFIDIMKRLAQQPQAELTHDMAHMQSLLSELEYAGYTPTTEGEGTMYVSEVRWLLSHTASEPQHYRMYSGGDDHFIVDTRHDEGIKLIIEQNMDGQREHAEVVIPNEDIWRFAVGMIARSYLEEGGYIPLTRFATNQYSVALETCLTELTASEHLAE